MKKILLIIQREYLTRVRKRSFIIMTILGPVLMAALVILPAYLSTLGDEGTRNVAVLDETGWFYQQFKDQENLHFYYVNEPVQQAKAAALLKGDLLLYIPRPELNVPVNAELYSLKQSGLDLRAYVKTVMKKVVENEKLLAQGIDPNVIKASKVSINLVTIKVAENGEEKESNTDVEMGLAIFSGMLIYFFIFMFGAQVMKGVMEEKSNRIVEVIISSVKPFQLMMGKIIGVAMVGLTQFLLWVLLTFTFVGIYQVGFGGEQFSSEMMKMGQQKAAVTQIQSSSQTDQSMAFSKVTELLSGVNFKVMIFSFVFYFLGGYLLYASLFAAVGGAIDHDADAQQFMLPISIPLIFSVAMTGVVANQPDGALAMWMSMIPFTSPVIMMMRIPFGVPFWQIGLSAALLIVTFVLTTFVAGKIYRIGILIYGKKVNYAELWKWLRY
jgi:ABC-2 type transport system permease protein